MRLYLGARVLSELTALVMSVAVGWQLYALTHSALVLGLTGLVQFIPILILTLPAGELCDQVGPKRMVVASMLLDGLCAAIFLSLTLAGVNVAWPYFASLVLFGVSSAALAPASQSMLPFLVSREALPRAIALNSSIMSVAVIAGPALGGIAYALSPRLPYIISTLAPVVAACMTAPLRMRDVAPEGAATLRGRLERVREGLRFVQQRPILLGAVSLDLFAVLFGGVTALLPIYARDILNVGPIGLGILRSASAAGAIFMALMLARYGLKRRAGSWLFATVGAFGASIIVFGLSHNFVLSVIALTVAGASDEISMYVRAALTQLATPDSMRGRVNSVYMLFVHASNEFGMFESGVAAALLGTVPSVVLGGIGTIVITVVWMKLFPALRNIDTIDSVQEFAELPTER